MKNEEEKHEGFFYLAKINLYFSETLNSADFKYVFICIFHIFLRSNATDLQSRLNPLSATGIIWDRPIFSVLYWKVWILAQKKTWSWSHPNQKLEGEKR